MQFALIILLSIWFLQFAAAETDAEKEERLDQMQIEHEEEHKIHREKRTTRSRPTPAPEGISPNIAERCACIPYQDYLVRIISKINFEFFNNSTKI
jgi:hypothetical protein